MVMGGGYRRLDDYLDRFKRMVAELAAHPRVRVTHCWYGAPVTDAEVARVEAALGYALAPEIVSFYRQANGLQLRWLDTGNESYVAGRDDVTKTERAHYLCGDNDEANGVIDLLPLGECLVDNDYDGQLHGDDWGSAFGLDDWHVVRGG